MTAPVRLVVDLAALQEVGVAVKDSPAALERVKQLILSSPSLTDVVGMQGEPQPQDPLRERALSFLLDNSEGWYSTQAVAKGCKTNQEAALLVQLKDLFTDGEVERRKKGQVQVEGLLGRSHSPACHSLAAHEPRERRAEPKAAYSKRQLARG